MENTNGNEQPQQPQPDDMVLLNAEQTLGMLVHKMVELQRRVNELETAKLLQQGLIDSQQHRIELIEGLLRGDQNPMTGYDQQLAAFESRAALIDSMMAELVRDGERLANLHQALTLAFEERMCREYRPGDEFTEGDEERAEQLLLELYPGGGA